MVASLTEKATGPVPNGARYSSEQTFHLQDFQKDLRQTALNVPMCQWYKTVWMLGGIYLIRRKVSQPQGGLLPLEVKMSMTPECCSVD